MLDFKKVANELSGPLSKVGAQLVDNDNSSPPEDFNRKVFITKSFE